jgi:predicted Rossmann fold nucleotide-binding protein DprA/Smf involved in DNA uptake
VPWNAQGLGCIAELQLGGRPLASHEDVLRWLDERQLHAIPASGSVSHVVDAGAEAPSAPAIARRRRGREGPAKSARPSGLEEAILQALRAGAQHPDQIGQMATLTPAEVSHGLLLLMLQGVVVVGEQGGVTLAR